MPVQPYYCCRMCGSTSYRRVLARDESGAIRATELYHCSGCSVVFADPKSWREGGADIVSPPLPAKPLTPLSDSPTPTAPAPPTLATYGLLPRPPDHDR
jgi:hypothetical protein